jgi:uncharacterized membrane protein
MAKIAIWIAFYPIIVHIGVQVSKIYLPIAYLAIIALIYLYSSKIKSWIIKVFLTAVIIDTVFLITILGKGYVVIQTIPILFLMALIFVFFKSLVFENTPMITNFAACVDDKPLNSDKKKYTRRVTIVWLLGFLYLAIQNSVAAIWLSIEDWSWIANTGSYILISLIMLSEFIYRNKKFKQDKISFKTFIVRLSRCRLK